MTKGKKPSVLTPTKIIVMTPCPECGGSEVGVIGVGRPPTIHNNAPAVCAECRHGGVTDTRSRAGKVLINWS